MSETAVSSRTSRAEAAPRIIDSLKHRHFRQVILGQVVSSLGDALLPVAVTFGLLAQNSGLSAVGWILAARTFAMVVGLLVGGVVADRYPKNHVMIAADVVRAGAVISIIISLQIHSVPITVASMFIFGMGEAFYRPAFRGLYPAIVPERLLQVANSAGSLSTQFAQVAGPALAGVLVGLMSPQAVLWVDVATFAVSTATLITLRRLPPIPRSEKPWKDVAEGITAVRQRRWMLLGIAGGMLQWPLAVAPWFVMLPAISLDRYGGTSPYGLSMSLYAAGAIAGALIASRITTAYPGVLAMAGVSSFSLVLTAMALPVPLIALLAAHFIAGLGLEVYAILWITAQQKDVPEHLLGRVSSLELLASAPLRPVAFAAVGAWADTSGRTGILIIGIAACLLTSIPLLADRSVRTLSSGHTRS
jgi:MFS family permease